MIGGSFRMIGGSITGTALTTLVKEAAAEGHHQILFEGVDMSSQSGNLVDQNWDMDAVIEFKRCLLHASATKISAALDGPGVEVNFNLCDSGTVTDPSFRRERYTREGTTTTQTATYRTGGATDGERTNPLSWKADSTGGVARSVINPMEIPPILGWTPGDGSSHTYRIYFASGGTQDDEDIWFELFTPNGLASNALPTLTSNRNVLLSATTNHTTDGDSEWTGSDIGTKQYMEITASPDLPGEMKAIVHVAGDAGGTGAIFIDPKIYVDP